MKNILVVEDEEIVRSNIAELLEAEGYTVQTANNGAEALQKLNSYIPDLIISDIMMPIVDGYELLKRIQEIPITSSIPVILLTARIETRDLRKGMQIGADDYLTKPFKANDLLDAVKTRLTKQQIYNRKFEDLKNHIATYIPHELRTPLVSILGFADLLISNMDDLSKEEIKEMAEKVRNSGMRLYDRIEKFLYFTDLELRKSFSPDQNILEIDSEYIQEQINTRFKNKDTSKIDVKLKKAKVRITDEYLMRILYELLDNSFKFTDEDYKISIKGHTSNGHYIIEVKDNGIGIDDFDIRQIEPFKQFNRDELQQQGTGLGLAIVKNILQIVKGEMEIESRLTDFTKVKVKVNLAE